MEEPEQSANNSSTGLFGLLVIGLLIWGGVKVFGNSGKWLGFYEMSTDRRIYTSREFDTDAQCGEWLRQQRAEEAVTKAGKYNFECGFKCKLPTTLGGVWVCDKTFDS